MMDFDGNELKAEFEQSFGKKTSELTEQQLWWLVKFAKHIRGRCRNNSAFNNYMNRNFAPARFTVVEKEYQGKMYDGLAINKPA